MADTTENEDNKDGSLDERSDTRPKRRRFGGKFKWLAVAVLAVVVAAGGYWYHRHGTFYPSTDDAYVKANVVRLAPEVGGRLVKVPVSDQQRIERGGLIFEIDPRPYQYKVDQAKAALDNARQTVAANKAGVAAADAHVADEKAALTTAQQNFRRAKDLAAKHVAAQSQLDDAHAALDSARAQLNLSKAQLNQAEKKLGLSGDRNHQVEMARAELDQAKLDLANTRITAPCTGRITGFTMHGGDVVNADAKEGVLVCSDRYWVYANYKETDLTRIRPGQKADISIDMYPDHQFHGIVESVNPASGSAFSLLPPENSSGNWVKVTQRVPVRILVTDAGDAYPMRVQTSAGVTVDTGTGTMPKGHKRGVTLSDAAAFRIAGRAQDGGRDCKGSACGTVALEGSADP